MTEDKARKRAVRARMAKTGERYTAAHRHLLQPTEPPPTANAADPGMSDEAITRGSGKGWEEWFTILDSWGGAQRSHGDIARYLHEEHGVPGWWAQSVTVGYERARGMRSAHQRPGGFYVTVSKTFRVDVDRLFRAFADGRERRRWLDAGTLRVRTTQPGKSARFDFGDGATRVHAYFTAKGESKASVQLEHERLADAEAVEETRAFWKARLEALAERLRRDDAPRVVDVPDELQDILASDAVAREAWDKLSSSHRKEYADWIAEAKRAETRQRRARKAAAMMAEGARHR